jgi:hypothetical protein
MIKPLSVIDTYLDQCNEEAIRFDGLDGAIIGVSHNGMLIYDFGLMMELFVEQGMTPYDAIEWYNYNVVSINGGQDFIVMYD